jgi:hypothetical protein
MVEKCDISGEAPAVGIEPRGHVDARGPLALTFPRDAVPLPCSEAPPGATAKRLRFLDAIARGEYRSYTGWCHAFSKLRRSDRKDRLRPISA